MCNKTLSSFEEENLTCSDCITEVSKGIDDIECGRIYDCDDVFRELEEE